MSAPFEDDIYDDLYGDSADTKDAVSQEPSPIEERAESATAPPAAQEKPQATGESSLPAKPTTAGELSYSAQIAQQFSAYKQTPAQERQQRPALHDDTDAVDVSPHDPSLGRRPVRPSEMKDEG